MMIYAGDVLYVIEHFGYIMAYDDNGALPVKPFGLYKVTRVRIPPPPPFWLRKLPKTGAFFV